MLGMMARIGFSWSEHHGRKGGKQGECNGQGGRVFRFAIGTFSLRTPASSLFNGCFGRIVNDFVEEMDFQIRAVKSRGQRHGGCPFEFMTNDLDVSNNVGVSPQPVASFFKVCCPLDNEYRDI